MGILVKTVSIYDVILIKNFNNSLYTNRKGNPEVHTDAQETPNSPNNLNKYSAGGGTKLDLKLY